MHCPTGEEPTLQKILIESGRFTIEDEEFQRLAREIKELNPEYEVRRVYTHIPADGPPPAGGPPFIEDLDVWIPWAHIAGGAAAAATQVVVRQVIEWFREQKWQRGPGPGGEVRPLPKYVNLYGPKGELLQVVEVPHPGAEPREREIEHPEVGRRNPSSLREWPPEQR